MCLQEKGSSVQGIKSDDKTDWKNCPVMQKYGAGVRCSAALTLNMLCKSPASHRRRARWRCAELQNTHQPSCVKWERLCCVGEGDTLSRHSSSRPDRKLFAWWIATCLLNADAAWRAAAVHALRHARTDYLAACAAAAHRWRRRSLMTYAPPIAPPVHVLTQYLAGGVT